MASRVFAVIAALGMIAGAYVYRYGAPGGDGVGGGSGRDAAAGAVICASELGPVCDALPGATVERAAETADRLIATAAGPSEGGLGAWVVPDPWPAMVDEARRLESRATVFGSQPTGVAETPVVAVARQGQLPAACPRPVTWRCLGDAAQEPSFRIGAPPVGHTVGLFARAAAVGGFIGDLGYATNDLQERPEAQQWLDNLDRRLDAAPGFGARSLDSFVLQQGSASVYLATGADASSLQENPQFEIVTPAEPVVVAAVVARPSAASADVDEDALRERFVAEGWEVTGSDQSVGLPSPGVLLALSEVG